jgi:hypothetical protein
MIINTDTTTWQKIYGITQQWKAFHYYRKVEANSGTLWDNTQTYIFLASKL